MAKKRYVSDSFWSDMWIENLDPLEKYLYLYLITNQLVSVCGIYEIQTKRIAYETGIDKEMVLKMLGRFQDDGKIFYKDGLLFIVNFVKNQSITKIDDNLWKGVEREIKELGTEKLAKITQIEGAYKVVEGAYKDVPIPYFTLLYSTLPIGYGGTTEEVKNFIVKKDNVEEVKKLYKETIGVEEVEKYPYKYGTLFELMQTGYKVKQSKEDIDKKLVQVAEYVVLNGVVGMDGLPLRDVAMGYAKKMRLRCEENNKVTQKHMSRFSKFLSDYKKTNVSTNK